MYSSWKEIVPHNLYAHYTEISSVRWEYSIIDDSSSDFSTGVMVFLFVSVVFDTVRRISNGNEREILAKNVLFKRADYVDTYVKRGHW